jgi:hypothetical protein
MSLFNDADNPNQKKFFLYKTVAGKNGEENRKERGRERTEREKQIKGERDRAYVRIGNGVG